MSRGPLFVGVDLGSTWVKAVAVEEDGKVAGRALVRTGISFQAVGEAALAELFVQPEMAGREAGATVATGYGRKNAHFARLTRTEISCHARGATAHYPGPFFVVDIGGQDNKIIEVTADGGVAHFLMNRKCAAGTGAFIEEIARRLDIGLGQLETLAEEADREITLSSFCTVFSATEVIKLIREGQSPANIARGIFNAVVARVVEMGPLGKNIVLTGGVAQAFPVVADILARAAGAEVLVPPNAQFIGALGAALLARDTEQRGE